jgi:glycosyltransferase involved in cell wall biosynthesis
MKKPNVVIVQQVVPHYRVPFFKRLGQSEKMTLAIAYGRERRGNSLRSEEKIEGLSTVPLRNVFFGPSNGFTYQADLLPFLRRRNCDVVIAEFDIHILSSILACFKARRQGIKFIWWGHGIGPRRRRLSRWIRIWLSRYADSMIFYDQEQADLFKSWGVSREKLFVAWNSIDTEEIDRLIHRWTATDRKRILYVGRLIPEKKVHHLVLAFASSYALLRPGSILTIIGDGPERLRLEKIVEETNMTQHVEFTGALFDQRLLAPFFNTSWVSVSPGCVGLSAIHSLAYGVPMVVADREPHGPEIAAIRNGVNALLFPSDSVAGLSEALVTLNGQADLLRKMSSAGYATVKDRFSLAAMVSAFESATHYALQQNRQ